VADDNIILENASFRQVKKAYLLKTKQPVKVILKDKIWIISVMQPTAEEPDPVVVLEIKGESK